MKYFLYTFTFIIMSDYYNYVDLVTYAGLYNRRFHTPEYVVYKCNDDVSKMYTLNGGYHNIRGPAYIVNFRRGCKCFESYYLNGELHNRNGPAHIEYYENGCKCSKSYYLNDKLHNRNGPAYIEYNLNGKIIRKDYWVDGVNKQKMKLLIE